MKLSAWQAGSKFPNIYWAATVEIRSARTSVHFDTKCHFLTAQRSLLRNGGLIWEERKRRRGPLLKKNYTYLHGSWLDCCSNYLGQDCDPNMLVWLDSLVQIPSRHVSSSTVPKSHHVRPILWTEKRERERKQVRNICRLWMGKVRGSGLCGIDRNFTTSQFVARKWTKQINCQ